ncbi:SPOR domain-containing protein [Pseudoalteromonas phenolica]|uniref:SPOR domain-containing protein n=1 Tax=Pseudoalteromonas phenolica TaxID=161398 RepID=UPI00110BD0C9|nr:SPOR domain-containing protein [Pseudoalteromonas phenolica]TMO54911.1 DedD protein [Pseudoalteromonas phenolica]
MNSGFLNRLVGTSIVVVAAIIFIPNILDGEKVHFKDGFKAIPERPEFTTIEIQQEIDAKAELAPEIKPEALHEEIALDAKPASTEKADASEIKEVLNTAANDSSSKPIQVVEEAKPEVEVIKPQQQVVEAKVDPLKRSETSNLTSMAYVIQLGSFSHKANVEALMKKLKNAGFTAFTQPIKTRNGELTKVFVGPQLDKADLEQKLPELEKLTKLKGRLTQFDITK